VLALAARHSASKTRVNALMDARKRADGSPARGWPPGAANASK
jgi:hypothetical protein